MSEFDEWAKSFEPRTSGQGKEIVNHPAKCMYAVREGPHKRACLEDAPFRSLGDLPVCARHQLGNVRHSWKGYVQGA